MKFLVQNILIMLTSYEIFHCIKNVSTYSINSYVNKSLVYRYKGDKKLIVFISMLLITFLIVNLNSFQLYKTYIDYLTKYNINELVSYSSKNFAIVMSINYFIVKIINICFKNIFDIKLYEDGLLYNDGRFIAWEKIKCIEYKKTFLKNQKVMKISLKNNKKIYFKNTDEENFKVLKEFIFSKAGIVSKEIMIV